jgi:hypothetical protein
VKTPPWLAEEINEQGAAVLAGTASRGSADTVVIATVREHPEFLAELGAAFAVRLLAKWLTEHTSGGDLFQAGMFPDLPATLAVAPKKRSGVADMTGPDLDKARNMLYARTENQIEGTKKAALAERAAFDGFYDKVRPRLTDGKTVGAVLAELVAQTAI